jgi:hypothetical protein
MRKELLVRPSGCILANFLISSISSYLREYERRQHQWLRVTPKRQCQWLREYIPREPTGFIHAKICSRQCQWQRQPLSSIFGAQPTQVICSKRALSVACIRLWVMLFEPELQCQWHSFLQSTIQSMSLTLQLMLPECHHTPQQ